MKIIKQKKENINLSEFLKMNEKSKDLILFKKLVRVIEEFLKSHYLKSYGMKKNKLVNAKGEEEADPYGEEYGGEDVEYYYDEEAPEEEQKGPVVNQAKGIPAA